MKRYLLSIVVLALFTAAVAICVYREKTTPADDYSTFPAEEHARLAKRILKYYLDIHDNRSNNAGSEKMELALLGRVETIAELIRTDHLLADANESPENGGKDRDRWAKKRAKLLKSLASAGIESDVEDWPRVEARLKNEAGIRAGTVLWAVARLGSFDYAYRKSLTDDVPEPDASWGDSLKCNLFVAHTLIKGGGVDIGHVYNSDGVLSWPHQANAWATKGATGQYPGGANLDAYFSFKNEYNSSVLPGDIWAKKNPNAGKSGHVGIHIGGGYIVHALPRWVTIDRFDGLGHAPPVFRHYKR